MVKKNVMVHTVITFQLQVLKNILSLKFVMIHQQGLGLAEEGSPSQHSEPWFEC